MDAAFDAIVVGGGAKGLVTAMYLAKYGEMSVAVVDRLQEVGGGWCGVEPAPGFVADACSSEIFPYYHDTLIRDFPGWKEKGARIIAPKVAGGGVYSEDDSCFLLYHPSYDVNRELTAKSIACFSKRDAETYLTLWGAWVRNIRDAITEMKYNPPLPHGKPSPLQKALADPRNKGIIDPHVSSMSVLQAGKVVWDSKEIISWIVRRCLSSGIDPNQPGEGMRVYMLPMVLSESGGSAGGSHNTAHAAHKVLIEHGATFFTEREVEKIVIENGVAKGVQLVDGSRILARKLVVSDVDPQQLCLRLIGRENLNSKIVRKIEAIESWRVCVNWYQWAFREPPKYKAAKFNPDVGEALTLVLCDRNLERYVKQYAYLSMGLPVPEPAPIVYSHAYDKTRCPDGRWVGLTECPEAAGSRLTAEQWNKVRVDHANDIIDTWSKYATNVNWDNVMGYIPITPYDLAKKLINMGPNGNWTIIDDIPSQGYRNRPIPELADHRMPLKNLYATGSAWGSDTAASATQGYSCYKVIAEDLGLRKSWEEHGSPW